MTREEISYLISSEGRKMVAANLSMDPAQFALQHRGAEFPVSAVATQLKNLGRARKKLPNWYAAGCVLPGRAVEQCSSEQAASLKEVGAGARALDLTMGLGVDSAYLARHYEEVVAVESDPNLFMLRENHRWLGIGNIDHRCTTAEKFLDEFAGPPFDLVFLDPDRRDDAGRRKFAIEDCAPDILALRERLSALGRRVMVKLSPMLDLTAVRRALDPLDRITVIAVDQEVKEVLVEWGQNQALQIGVAFARQGVEYHYHAPQREISLISGDPAAGGYAYEADISLYKAGMVAQWWQDCYPELEGGMNHATGYWFSRERLHAFPGRAFEIEAVLPYRVKDLKRELGQRKIRQVNYSRRYFDVPLAQVRQKLRIPEGGEAYLLFTRNLAGNRIVLLGRRCQ